MTQQTTTNWQFLAEAKNCSIKSVIAFASEDSIYYTNTKLSLCKYHVPSKCYFDVPLLTKLHPSHREVLYVAPYYLWQFSEKYLVHNLENGQVMDKKMADREQKPMGHFVYNNVVHYVYGNELGTLFLYNSSIKSAVLHESKQFGNMVLPMSQKNVQVGHHVYLSHENASTSSIYKVNMVTYQVQRIEIDSDTPSRPGKLQYYKEDGMMYGMSPKDRTLVQFDTKTHEVALTTTASSFPSFSSWFHTPCIVDNMLVEIIQVKTLLHFYAYALPIKKSSASLQEKLCEKMNAGALCDVTIL